MKVKDLINSLKEYNPNANVVLTTSEEIFLSFIGDENTSKKNAEVVFIEGCDFCASCYYYDIEYCKFYEDYCYSINDCEIFDKEGQKYYEDN